MSEHGGSWANPSPAGLVALAIACFMFYAVFTGRVTGGALPLMGVWLMGGFLVQVIVGIIELKEGNIAGGNVFTFFAGFFMFVSAFCFIIKWWAGANGIALDPKIEGFAWLVIAIAVTLWAPAYFTGAKSMTFLVCSIAPACWLISFMDLGIISRAVWGAPTGYLILLAGIFGLYTAGAIMLNTVFQKVVLPVGSPIIDLSKSSAGKDLSH